MTKSMQNKMVSWYYRFIKSNTRDIHEAYSNPSSEKVRTYHKILENNCNTYDYYDTRIIGKNCHHYTVATLANVNVTKWYFIVNTYTATYKCGYNHYTGDLIDLDTGETIK